MQKCSTDMKLAKKIARLGLLLALSLILFLVENLFPPLFPFAPFIRLGLGNAIITLVLVKYGFREGGLVLLAKCLVSALFQGVFSLCFSLTGGIASLAVSALLFHSLYPRLSLTGICGVAAAVHNAVQLVVYAILGGSAVLWYIPVSVCISLPVGALCGLCVALLLRALPDRLWQ